MLVLAGFCLVATIVGQAEVASEVLGQLGVVARVLVVRLGMVVVALLWAAAAETQRCWAWPWQAPLWSAFSRKVRCWT